VEHIAREGVLLSATSNIASEPSGPSWITPSLLQLCVSGGVVFQLVSEQAVVILNIAVHSDIAFLRYDNCSL